MQSLYQSAKFEDYPLYRLMGSLYLTPLFTLVFLFRICPLSSAESRSKSRNNGWNMNACPPDDWRERKIREWPLPMLRLAITREPRDRFAVFAMADELDALGHYWRPTASRFFARTAGEVCDAILGIGDDANVILQKHIARIGDLRLRGAFAAAIDLDPEPGDYLHRSIRAPQQLKSTNERPWWRGLLRK
jgi:hypothetical protein